MANKIKVLMVDDEERFRETTSKLLRKRGFATTIAKNGEEAISIIKDKPQDVVILDIKMDGMDGLEALTEIKKIDPDVQVIMLTGHGTSDSAIKALVREAFDYLNKPCDMDTLSLKINDAYKAKHHGTNGGDKNARDIMIHIDDYTIVNVDTTVKEAIKKLMDSFKSFVSSTRLMETGHRSLLVFDNRDELAGVLSIMDLIEAIRPAYLSAPKPSMADSVQYSSMFWDGLFTTQSKDIADKRVGDFMSEAPIIVDENANLMEVADLMYKTNMRRIMVSGNGRIIGIIREQDIFFEIANIIL
ncbi:MAG: response regulator [Desulfobacteraceae bacterium]|nr:response regulator [Desulfobacteraceae bacterium]